MKWIVRVMTWLMLPYWGFSQSASLDKNSSTAGPAEYAVDVQLPATNTIFTVEVLSDGSGAGISTTMWRLLTEQGGGWAIGSVSVILPSRPMASVL